MKRRVYDLLKEATFLLATQRGPNMFSCFSTVKQKQKQEKTKLYLLTKGAPFIRRGGGPRVQSHPGTLGQSATAYKNFDFLFNRLLTAGFRNFSWNRMFPKWEHTTVNG